MKTIKKVAITPKHVFTIPDTFLMDQDVIYISLQYKTASHLCLCGCKEVSVTPLNKNGWTLTEEKNKISLTPSILNNNCPNKSHYIITNNKANFV